MPFSGQTTRSRSESGSISAVASRCRWVTRLDGTSRADVPCSPPPCTAAIVTGCRVDRSAPGSQSGDEEEARRSPPSATTPWGRPARRYARRAFDRSGDRRCRPGECGAELEHHPRDEDHPADSCESEQGARRLRDAQRRKGYAAEGERHPGDFGERVGGGSSDRAPRTGRCDHRRHGVERCEQRCGDQVSGNGEEPHPTECGVHPRGGEREATPAPSARGEPIAERDLEQGDADEGQRPEPPRRHRECHQQTGEQGERGRPESCRYGEPVGHQPTRSAKTTMRWEVEPGG